MLGKSPRSVWITFLAMEETETRLYRVGRSAMPSMTLATIVLSSCGTPDLDISSLAHGRKLALGVGTGCLESRAKKRIYTKRD